MNDIVLSEHNQNIIDHDFIVKVFSNIDVSDKTRNDYLSRINHFVSFLKDHPFDRNIFVEYKRSLSLNDKISVSTKNKYLIVSKVFLQSLYRLGVISVDVVKGVRGFRQSSGFKTNGFTEEEIKLILQGLNDTQDIRLKVIGFLKMFQGLRDEEITLLEVGDIDLQNGFISIMGKGRDEKESLPLIPRVSEVLMDYLTKTEKKSGYLLTSIRGENTERLTTKTIWLQMRSFLDSLQIHRNPHQCRSFYITSLVRHIPDLFTVISYSRHRSVTTLQKYVNQINLEKTIPQFREVFNTL
jgi:integrase